MNTELNFSKIFLTIRKYFVFMLIIIFFGIAGSVLFMYFVVTPQYSSQAELLVNQYSEQPLIQFNEVQTNLQLINTYRAIITGDAVLGQVDENLGGQYGVGLLREAISVNQPQDSQTFYISATMESPEEAQVVVEETIEVFESTISEAYRKSDVTILVLSQPTFNEVPDSPKLIAYVLLGANLGLIFGVIVIIFKELMDTTVSDNDFFAQQGLMNLGLIYEASQEKPQHLKNLQPQIDESNLNRSHIKSNNNKKELSKELFDERPKNPRNRLTVKHSLLKRKKNAKKVYRINTRKAIGHLDNGKEV